MSSRIGVLAPLAPGEDDLEIVFAEARALFAARAALGISQVVLALDPRSARLKAAESLSSEGLEIRHCAYEMADRKFLTRFLDVEIPFKPASRIDWFERPVDLAGGYDFLDCDAWIVFAPPARAPLAPIKPYAARVTATDILSRIRPVPMAAPRDATYDSLLGTYWTSFRHKIETWRSARSIFASSRDVLEQATGYIGVPPGRCIDLPAEIASAQIPLGARPSYLKSPYLVCWLDSQSLTLSGHRLEALRIYLEECNGTLDVVVAGPALHARSNSAAAIISGFQKQLETVRKPLRRRFHFRTEFTIESLATLVSHARLLWRTGIYGGGETAFSLAAGLGVPVVASRDTTMPEWSVMCPRPWLLHAPDDERAAANALAQAEAASTHAKDTALPLPHRLAERSALRAAGQLRLVQSMLASAAPERQVVLPKAFVKELE